jgi:DNA primase large subunit
MVRDESYIRKLTSRIAEDIEERYGKPPNFIQLQSLIQRFVRNNPDADPEDIDWVSTWDPKLEYTEMVKAFKDRYPMYKWEEEEAYDEERYLSELYNYLLTQARELPEDLRARLVKELAFELGVQPPTRPAVTAVEAKPEAVRAVEKPRKVTVTLELMSKYPILPQVSKFLEGIKMTEISKEVVDRAFMRIRDAVEYNEVKSFTDNYYVEVVSYPVTVMILTAVGNEWAKRRWALSEGVRIEKQLDIEDDDVFDFIIGRMGFEKVDEDVEHPLLKDYAYRVPVTRYLKVIGDLLRDVRWKLVNQLVHRGYVYIRSRAEVSRVIREVMKNLLIQKFQKVSPRDVPKSMPSYFWETVEKVKQLLSEKAPKHMVDMVVQVRGDIPPCIAQMISKIRVGEDISHVENFTVAAYLLNTGHSVEEVVEIFKDRSDFNEKIARYQVEHIAGLRGSRVRYKPPSCSKMKSYGLCIENGNRCPKRVKNPLNYRVERGGEGDEGRQVS